MFRWYQVRLRRCCSSLLDLGSPRNCILFGPGRVFVRRDGSGLNVSTCLMSCRGGGVWGLQVVIEELRMDQKTRRSDSHLSLPFGWIRLQPKKVHKTATCIVPASAWWFLESTPRWDGPGCFLPDVVCTRKEGRSGPDARPDHPHPSFHVRTYALPRFLPCQPAHDDCSST
jgi:hypothetical protein